MEKDQRLFGLGCFLIFYAIISGSLSFIGFHLICLENRVESALSTLSRNHQKS